MCQTIYAYEHRATRSSPGLRRTPHFRKGKARVVRYIRVLCVSQGESEGEEIRSILGISVGRTAESIPHMPGYSIARKAVIIAGTCITGRSKYGSSVLGAGRSILQDGCGVWA